MAKGRLDPSFMAAPYFGPSSYDPIKAVEAAQKEKYGMLDAYMKKKQKDYEEGQKEFDLDIKSWEDERGYEELSTELDNIKEQYIDLNEKGFNVYNPGSGAERKIAKAFRDRMGKLKHKHDVWQRQKGIIDEAEKTLRAQLALPEDRRDIDIEASMETIKKWKEGEGILDREMGVGNLLVGKSRPVDVGNYFQAAIPKFVPGTDRTMERTLLDETTGKWRKTSWEGVDPRRAKEGILKAFKAAPANVRNAVEKMYDEDPDKGVLSMDEWIVDTYGPVYPSKTTEERGISGAGSGAGSGRGGLPEKDAEGNYPLQPQLRDIYFNTSSKGGNVVPFEGMGRVPIGDVFGYKNITMMGSANNMNAITGKIEGKGTAIPGVPVEANIYPVASEQITIDVIDPNGTETIEEVVQKGERIPLHVLEQMRQENAEAREAGDPPPHLYDYEPFIHFGLAYKQVKEGDRTGMPESFNIYMPQTDRAQSYTETSIVPYNEVRQDLFAGAKENKKDWAPYDQYIRDISRQLNAKEEVRALFEVGEKSIDDLFRELED